MEQKFDIGKKENLEVSKRPYFIIYEVTFKQTAQLK